MRENVSSSRLTRVPPTLALAVAVVAVSTSAPLIELSQAPSSVKALYRVLFMTALVTPVALRRNADDFARITTRDLGIALVTGIALAAHFALWFVSFEFTTIAASATLVQTQPLFVAFGAWALLSERVTRQTVVGILVAVAGAATIGLGAPTSSAAPQPLLGNGLAVGAAAMASIYVLAGRSLRQRVNLFPYVSIVYGACTVGLFGLVLYEGHDLTGYPATEYLLFLGMAVGPGIFGHTVINWLLERVESSVVSVSLLGEPVGSAILALAIFGEVPGLATVVGGAIALVGIGVVVWSRQSGDASDEPVDGRREAGGEVADEPQSSDSA
ncbi:DMT family transporter [Haloarchaeobius sp. TZWWS8]|uniref:DMT family transporter n=1 Tax=Haloarchaeobius sp. TZWWS8 TaxID=3446121 RepID=UPI003EB6AF22